MTLQFYTNLINDECVTYYKLEHRFGTKAYKAGYAKIA